MNEVKLKKIDYDNDLKQTMIFGFIIRIFLLWFIVTIGWNFTTPYFIVDDIKYENMAVSYLIEAKEFIDINLMSRLLRGYMQPFWPIVMFISSYMFKNIIS